MAGRAGKNLLAGERESIISSACEAMPRSGLERMESLGGSTREILAAILDFVLGEGMEDLVGTGALREVAELLLRHDIPWSVTAGLCRSLADGIYSQPNGMGEREEAVSLSGALLRAQSQLFGFYLERQGGKREGLAALLREFDRFPDTIAATLDPPTLVKVGLGRLTELIPSEDAAIFSVDAKRRLVPMAGGAADEHGGRTVMELRGSAAFALLHAEEPYWEGPEDDERCFGAFGERGGGRDVLALPLVVRGRTTAVVLLSSGADRERLSPDEIELARSFANRLAVAMENACLHEREQWKIRETVALLEIARAINSTLDLEEILEKVVQMTVDLCGVVMSVVYLREGDRDLFVPAASHGFIEDVRSERMESGAFTLHDLERRHRETIARGDAVVLPSGEAAFLLPTDVMRDHGVDLVFATPLRAREELTGMFALFYTCRGEAGLGREEMEVVGAIAAQASMAIENAALYEDIEKSYFSTVQALAKAIEVKDPYTHGHSERVMEYALLIADALHLDERDRQKLKYAATLHDIGKIGIAGRVLNKPGDLTDEEYSHVKTHPMLGDSIIEPVEFLQGPRPIILHHHERFDGSGYPLGLKGSDIPLCARILAVADAFEAMRSDRPYRLALPLAGAREELERNAGGQFDPEVVDAFLEILEGYGGDPIKR